MSIKKKPTPPGWVEIALVHVGMVNDPPDDALDRFGGRAAWAEYRRRLGEKVARARAEFQIDDEKAILEIARMQVRVDAFVERALLQATSERQRKAQRGSAEARRDDVLWAKIRADRADDASIRALARDYKMPRSTVERICKGIQKGSLKK